MVSKFRQFRLDTENAIPPGLRNARGRNIRALLDLELAKTPVVSAEAAARLFFARQGPLGTKAMEDFAMSEAAFHKRTATAAGVEVLDADVPAELLEDVAPVAQVDQGGGLNTVLLCQTSTTLKAIPLLNPIPLQEDLDAYRGNPVGACYEVFPGGVYRGRFRCPACLAVIAGGYTDGSLGISNDALKGHLARMAINGPTPISRAQHATMSKLALESKFADRGDLIAKRRAIALASEEDLAARRSTQGKDAKIQFGITYKDVRRSTPSISKPAFALCAVIAVNNLPFAIADDVFFEYVVASPFVFPC